MKGGKYEACFNDWFSGLLATRLLHALMQKYESAHFVLLVHPSQVELANERIKGLDKVEVILGDITEETLGFSEEDSDLLREKLTHVFHLAAIYDLAVPQLIAEKVNVEGTKILISSFNHYNIWKDMCILVRHMYRETVLA